MLTRRNLLLSALSSAKPRALIVDGRNNHDWRMSSPLLRRLLEPWFEVSVATAPDGVGPVGTFAPNFSAHAVTVLNYADFGNGGAWPEATQRAFEKYILDGGGVVVYHAACSSFAAWAEYNRIIGLGGWGGRNEKSGPKLRYRDGRIIRDMSAGDAGHHGKRHEFAVIAREPAHPIMAGLPAVWMHTSDELYDSLRGPAQDLEVLATAWSDPVTGGTGEHEPVLFTVRYGSGRVFHTVLGHDQVAIDCSGFALTLVRGAEWAATGRVKIPVPDRFPTATRSVRFF